MQINFTDKVVLQKRILCIPSACFELSQYDLIDCAFEDLQKDDYFKLYNKNGQYLGHFISKSSIYLDEKNNWQLDVERRIVGGEHQNWENRFDG